MIIQNTNDPFASYEPVYDFDGTVRVLARAAPDVHEGELYKIVYSLSGFVAISLGNEPHEYYVGYALDPITSGKFGFFQIGGITPGISVADDAVTGAAAFVRDGDIWFEDYPFAEPRHFGFLLVDNGEQRIHLLPRMVHDDYSRNGSGSEEEEPIG